MIVYILTTSRLNAFDDILPNKICIIDFAYLSVLLTPQLSSCSKTISMSYKLLVDGWLVIKKFEQNNKIEFSKV